ncbi:FAIM1 (Fas apoptotic inhibitory molecule) protein [Clostridium sp. KNHs216]|nr:FAIM1 (Fas apoptotic inhibitory molecule) protein [Clostridium sp. KNHs216]
MHQWDIFVNETKHEIVFEGCKISGKIKLRIDGNPVVYSPFLVKKVGMFCPFEVDGSEMMLRLDLKNYPVGLIQDGIYLETGMPMEETVLSAFRSAQEDQNPIIANDRAGMGAFLTFVGLTYVNLILILMNASLSFPFSATVPQLVLGIALSWNEEAPSTVLFVSGIVLSVIFASVYLLLYLLAKKRFWPVVVALVLVVLDTLVVLYLSLDDFTFYIIDIVFHAWLMWSLIKLIGARRKQAEQYFQ